MSKDKKGQMKKDRQLICTDESGRKLYVSIEDISGWEEIKRSHGKNKGDPYVVPENRYISIRFPVGTEGKRLRIFVEEEDLGNEDEVCTE